MKSLALKLLKGVALIAIGGAIATFAPGLLHNDAGPAKEQMPVEIAAETAKSAASGPQAPAIRVIAAKRGEIAEFVTATGSVVAREEAQVGADVAGLKVEELFFDTGDQVKAGDVLARLERSSVELQLTQIAAQLAQVEANKAQAESQLTNAEIGVRQAQEQFDRVAPLVKSGVVSKAQRDNAQNALDSAIAQRNSARQAITVVESQRAVLAAQRKQAELQLEKTDITAPVDGIVLARNATMGQVVSGSAGPLFRIARNGEFELAARVAESSLARLKPGLAARVRLPGMDDAVAGTVRLIAPEIDRLSRLGTVSIALPAGETFRAGSFGEASIEIARREGVLIPASAVLYRGQDPYVQLVVGDRVESRDITIGLKDGFMLDVTSGLVEGDEIVSRAGTFVADGDAIRPVRDEPTASVN